MGDLAQPLARAGLLARVAPFAIAMALAPVAVLVPPGVVHPPALIAAAALTVLIAVSAFAIPWARLAPGWTVTLPLAYVAVVALLRYADGGADSELAPLVLLPVAWTALHGSRWQVGAVVASVPVALAAPIALMDYPSSEWRRVAVWCALAAVVGYAVARLVAEIGQPGRGVAPRPQRPAAGGAEADRRERSHPRARRGDVGRRRAAALPRRAG